MPRSQKYPPKPAPRGARLVTRKIPGTTLRTQVPTRRGCLEFRNWPACKIARFLFFSPRPPAKTQQAKKPNLALAFPSFCAPPSPADRKQIEQLGDKVQNKHYRLINKKKRKRDVCEGNASVEHDGGYTSIVRGSGKVWRKWKNHRKFGERVAGKVGATGSSHWKQNGPLGKWRTQRCTYFLRAPNAETPGQLRAEGPAEIHRRAAQKHESACGSTETAANAPACARTKPGSI